MIVAMGELLIDLITDEIVTDLSTTEGAHAKVAGSPANFAMFCKKLNVEVVLVGSVGNDGLGNKIRTHVESIGISSQYIATHASQPTSLILVGKSHGTPEFIAYRGADAYLEAVPAQLLQQAGIVHTTAFALSREPARTHILEACEAAVQAGKSVSCDWNYAAKIWGAFNNAASVFEQILACKPLLKISLDDAIRFWGIGNVEEAKQKITHLTVTVVCLTCGADGVWFKSEGEDWQFLQSLPATVKDVTGAGDAFWAGFITAYSKERPLQSCVENALLVAKQRIQQEL